MSANKDCGCSETTVEHIRSPRCAPKPCDCAVKDLSTDCVIYGGEGLECVGVETNISLTETLETIDSAMCEIKDSINNTVNLANVGDGVGVYKGVSSIGTRQLKTLLSDGIVTITETDNEITISAEQEVVEQDNFVKQILINEYDLPEDYDESDICTYVLSLPEEDRTFGDTTSKVNIIVYLASS